MLFFNKDKFFRFLLFCLFFVSSSIFAENQPIILNKNPYSISIDTGIAKPTNLGFSTHFPLGYSTFTYSPDNSAIQTLISGISLSKTITLFPLYTLQMGISYHYLSNIHANGNLVQGITPPYYQSNYSYNINSSQYVLEGKIHRQIHNHFFPYLYLALGEASNKASDFVTNVPAYLTVTPTYNNKTTNSFSYSVGLGFDYFVLSKVSLGLGYRFTDLGKMGLGTGTIRNTTVNNELSQSHLYLNTLFAQLSYFI